MPFMVKINVALRKRICQKIGSKGVKTKIYLDLFFNSKPISHFHVGFREETGGRGGVIYRRTRGVPGPHHGHPDERSCTTAVITQYRR